MYAHCKILLKIPCGWLNYVSKGFLPDLRKIRSYIMVIMSLKVESSSKEQIKDYVDKAMLIVDK